MVVVGPNGALESTVMVLLLLCFATVAGGALRAVGHVLARGDLTHEDKRVWPLWFWLASPIAVPFYLRRAGL